MSGPQNCYICTTKFSFFKKQYECKGCHRTTCKECQSYKSDLPGLGTQQVCKNCHDARKQKAINSKSGRVSPPANFKREMKKKQVMRQEKEVNDPVDQDLENRLNLLRGSYENEDIKVEDLEDRLRKLCGSEITDEEIEYRLAKLKGSRPPAIRVHSMRKRDLPPDQPHSSKPDSDAKQIKRLIRQYTAEIELEGGIQAEENDAEDFKLKNIPENPSTDDLIELAKLELQRDKEEVEAGRLKDEEIRKRLSQLQDPPTSPMEWKNNEQDQIDSDMDEESSKLIQQILEEDRLEQTMSTNQNQEQKSTIVEETAGKTEGFQPDPDELPWCYLCNGDANVRCLTCEGDLFCNKCFKYAHKDSDMKGHATKKYTKKPGQYDEY